MNQSYEIAMQLADIRKRPIFPPIVYRRAANEG
jgi:hypothetical protein